MLTKLLYGITALILALALGGFVVLAHSLSKAENRAVEVAKLAVEYQRSLESLERAVAAQAKSAKQAQETMENRAKRAEQQAAKAKKENHALQEALAASREWADVPIPPGVYDALSH